MIKSFIYRIGVVLLIGICACSELDELVNADAPLTDVEREAELSIVSDDAQADQEYDVVEAELDFVIRQFEESSNARSSTSETTCAVVTLDTVLYNVSPLSIINEYTVDFGEEGCESEVFGITRVLRGKLHVVDEALLSNAQTRLSLKRSIVFESFYANDVKVEGTRTTRAIFEEGQNDLLISTLKGGKLTFFDGSSITRDADWTIEKVAGESFFEEEFSIEGNASGQKRDGGVYTMEVVSPLIVKRSCGLAWIPVSGEKRFTSSNHSIQVNYGDGTCDDEGYVVSVSLDDGDYFTVNLSE
ncbi:hypothetical protein [Sediminitomix flava]|uniref:Lipoprotein n=1 Tax=Sediminitomix flava TaxID=379075 RepID=A0A315ZEF8_SEDFL|nr:hypothetical protein [Sediminitomix flava]PWJ43114.1 hypothetical protein BC781_102663 [Sediminitomix flava]